MSGLKVVALISGGKDSLFSILHCQANGHEVVALANLYPARQNGSTSEDSDSYMYQTIGHAVIPLYEKVLGLPLYRQEILGDAVEQSKNYGPEAPGSAGRKDETESLVPLLEKVKSAHPDVNAVSTGAILSDYQRTRVESVALRLGLTPLSYLWQFPHLPPATPTALLEDMAAVGQDSRIIKVASGGLDDGLLWQNVADRRTIARLKKASMLFGVAGDGSALGEGGEYETLAVAGPAPLWKGRIVVGDGEMETVPGEAGSASVRIISADAGSLEVDSSPEPRKPNLLENKFESLFEALSNTQETSEALQPGSDATESPGSVEGHVLIEGITGPGNGAAAQTVAIMQNLQQRLANVEHTFDDVAYTSIVLRDMNDFAEVNKIYGKYFTRANPPARVTLACSSVLPEGAFLTISATSVRTTRADARRGLHVQSRSYWAPANIGPYSQAITVPTAAQSGDRDQGLIYVAGQIPLVPASMELCKHDSEYPDKSFLLQAVLALQHLFRIGSAVGSCQWLSIIAFITAPSAETASKRADAVRSVWSRAHQPAEAAADAEEDDENFDVWHLQHGQGRGAWQGHSTEVGEKATTGAGGVPPIMVCQVDTLPRGASTEWVAYGSTESDTVHCRIPHFEYLKGMFQDCAR